MNSLEIDALQLSISNHARVLYALYLRPKVNQEDQKVKLVYSEILHLLNAKETQIQLGRQVNALLKELHKIGLIELFDEQDFKRSLNQQCVSLPLIKNPINTTIPKMPTGQSAESTHYQMNIDWRPETEIFEQICQLVGVIEQGYSTEELGEFIAYWLGQPHRLFTTYQWTQKFVLIIKQRRQRFPISKQQSKVGHQWVTLDVDIEIDENVRQLVQKYSGKT